eukprot:3824111-Prymnesium_polylepis.3
MAATDAASAVRRGAARCGTVQAGRWRSRRRRAAATPCVVRRHRTACQRQPGGNGASAAGAQGV